MTPLRSIVIPCYNERNRLPPTLDAVAAFIAASGVPTEILVVDDGSRDGTAAWAESQRARMPGLNVLAYTPNRGKGHAVKTGILAAQGQSILFMDADGSTPVTESAEFWPLLERNQADVVAGSRKIDGARIEADQSSLRRLASDFYGALTRLLVLRGISDTQCGFKAMTRQAGQAIFTGFDNPTAIFDIELFVVAGQRGLRIAELPVTWQHDPDSRLTYNLRKSIRIFSELLKIKWRRRLLLPVVIHAIGGRKPGNTPHAKTRA